MKKFQGTRPRDDVIARFEELGWDVNSEKYDELGSDWTILTSPQDCIRIQWSSWNGHFNGQTIAGVKFSHDSENLDDQPWYLEFLDIFYISEEEA